MPDCQASCDASSKPVKTIVDKTLDKSHRDDDKSQRKIVNLIL